MLRSIAGIADDLPADVAEQHHHYLYGTPKWKQMAVSSRMRFFFIALLDPSATVRTRRHAPQFG